MIADRRVEYVAMLTEYHTAMLWGEEPLSYVEPMSRQPFMDAGHEATLGDDGVVDHVPEAVALVHGRVTKTNWYLCAWESEHDINRGMLDLPQDIATLDSLLEISGGEYGFSFRYNTRVTAKLRDAAEAVEPVDVRNLPLGLWGPLAMTAWLDLTGENQYAFPHDVLYTVAFQNRRQVVKAGQRRAAERFLTDKISSIHFYGRSIRTFLASHPQSLPDEGGPIIYPLKTQHRPAPGANYREGKIRRARMTVMRSSSKRGCGATAWRGVYGEAGR